MTPQFGASLIDNASSVNYDRNIFIMQATGNKEAEHATQHPKIWDSSLGRVKMAKKFCILTISIEIISITTIGTVINIKNDTQYKNNQHHVL